jgi:hypothetical protein
VKHEAVEGAAEKKLSVRLGVQMCVCTCVCCREGGCPWRQDSKRGRENAARRFQHYVMLLRQILQSSSVVGGGRGPCGCGFLHTYVCTYAHTHTRLPYGGRGREIGTVIALFFFSTFGASSPHLVLSSLHLYCWLASRNYTKQLCRGPHTSLPLSTTFFSRCHFA